MTHPYPWWRRILAVAVLTIPLLAGGLASPSWAQTAAISGTVVGPDEEAVSDVHVRLRPLGRIAQVDDEGRFAFFNIPPGQYLLEAVSQRSGRAIERVTVGSGQEAEVRISLDPLFHADEIVVTATPGARQRSELAQAVGVLSGDELARKVRATLGETLAEEPGVNSTYFGPGASRPVIRGLAGDRIRILESGVGSGDASSTSPDHAVSVEPLSAERIEILRGPATLLYGSNAVGGVVNVIDGRIPSELPARDVEGTVQAIANSVANERSGGISLTGGLARLAWHLEAQARETDDVEIPGPASLDPEDGDPDEEDDEGELANSAIETVRGVFGLSYVGESGFVGASFSGYDTEYGVPGGEEEDVLIDAEQRRFDFETAWRFVSGAIQGVRARIGRADYQHDEIEGGEIGTVFDNEEWEGRVEVQHRSWGPLEGAFGFQFRDRDFAAIGEEAFVPPTETGQIAFFLFEEIPRGPVTWQFGARFEHQTTSAETAGDPEEDFNGVSLSGGVTWRPDERWAIGLQGARSVKLPNAEELFSDGPHLATRSFDVGDPDLDEEVGTSLDASVRLAGDRVAGEVTYFVNRFDDFVFQGETGEFEDGLPVRPFLQDDALFTGFEYEADLEIFHRGPHHAGLTVWGDFVWAELTDEDRPVPRIPPARVNGAVRYEGPAWNGRVAVRRVNEQDRVFAFETPTEGYTMLDASIGYRFFSGVATHDITLSMTNLTDEEGRNHTSFLKDDVLLPGRDFRLMYRLAF